MHLVIILNCYQTFNVDLYWNRSVVNLVQKLSNEQLILDENLIEICTKPSSDPIYLSFKSNQVVLNTFVLPSQFPTDNITLYLSMLVSTSLQNFREVQTNVSKSNIVRITRGQFQFESVLNRINEVEPVVLKQNNTPVIVGIVVGVVVLAVVILITVYFITRKYKQEQKTDYSLKGMERIVVEGTLVMQSARNRVK
ncbi:Hypothetical_protein [Hexamita inflata]|uniref:Hypothetical_protein n=1 Tax=Hexamita inflata TaxID=28002 RepID=A0AA86UXX0_9EUKA|nr:Hypothetical protein HINF_LOCUS56581 [Hexamita inflata]